MIQDTAEVISEKVDYLLLIDIDWFGKTIPAGAIFKQVNADYWQPIFNNSRHPSHQIDFYTVRNNPKYFIQIQK